MSYRTTGLRELAGSAAGIDARRVRGDLERFKTFIEERGTATEPGAATSRRAARRPPAR